MRNKIKILLYYTHKESLGHTSRITTLADAFASFGRGLFEVYLLQAGVPQHTFRPKPGITKIDVPYPFYSKAQFKNLPADIRNIGLRADFILDKTKDIMPDVFMTEYFPFGRSECFLELSEAFLFLKKQRKKILATIGYPYITLDVIKNVPRFFKEMRFYDKIFIHTPENFEYPYFLELVPDKERRDLYASIFASLKEKIIHTGYILPRCTEGAGHPAAERLMKRWKKSKRKKILVSRGGGTTCPKIIASAILAKRYLGDDAAMLLSAGPASGRKEMEFFEALVRKHGIKHTSVVPYVPHFADCLGACDVSVSLAGYNTSVQLLRLGKKCIIAPYTVLAKSGWINDQTPRARLLEKHLNARLFDYDGLRSETLAGAIKDVLQAPAPKPLPPAFFEGAAATVKTVLKIL
ncbi:MAG: glycosyltransferase [Candidatus Velamenicoccus archaeovorus]